MSLALNNDVLSTAAVQCQLSPTFTFGPESLTFAPGELVVVLGKNGAGKSTFFNLLTGNLDATNGHVTLGERRVAPDTPATKRLLGYLPQELLLPRWVSGRDLLIYAARLHQLKDSERRADESLAHWDLGTLGRKPVATLSYGSQRRVGLALATLHHPRILILDEPHSGLDLLHVKTLNDLIAKRGQDGLTTIFSTHVAYFAATLAVRALIVEEGRVCEVLAWPTLSQAARMDKIDQAFFGSRESIADA